MASIPKVDVHHHVVPPEIAGVTDGMKGMKAPVWDINADDAFCQSINIRTRIYSVSTPGVSYISNVEEAAATARSMNEYCAKLRDEDPQSRGFFATVPSLEHSELVLRELCYAFDTLHADGVTLFTRYGNGNGYLGHPDYTPVWAELNYRKAVVFVHPIDSADHKSFSEQAPGPTFDWPHETARTAMDLILNRRLQQFPDVKIILSHAGGTLATLIRRSTLISLPEFGSHMSTEDILDQAKSFYFDLALSGSPEVLPQILWFAKKGHVLFGSDYPHATASFSTRCTKFVDEYEMQADMREEIYHGAAESLFPRLKGLYKGN